MRALRDREQTPEQLGGMTEGPNRFNVAGDSVSDSEESHSVEDASGRAAKRVRVEEETEQPPLPKWSNPDPYTALPPPDESRTKRKDVVKLIQNAKVTAADRAASENAIADNADFVSFDFGDDNDDSSAENYSPPEPIEVVEMARLNIVNTIASAGIPIANLPSSTTTDLYVTSGFKLQVEGLGLFESGPNFLLQTNPSERAEAVGAKRKRNVIPVGSIVPEWNQLGRIRNDPTPWFNTFPASSNSTGQW
jgi:hypothetical protein